MRNERRLINWVRVLVNMESWGPHAMTLSSGSQCNRRIDDEEFASIFIWTIVHKTIILLLQLVVWYPRFIKIRGRTWIIISRGGHQGYMCEILGHETLYKRCIRGRWIMIFDLDFLPHHDDLKRWAERLHANDVISWTCLIKFYTQDMRLLWIEVLSVCVKDGLSVSPLGKPERTYSRRFIGRYSTRVQDLRVNHPARTIIEP